MRRNISFLAGFIFAGVAAASAQASVREFAAADPEFDQILSLDIADLVVTSVAKREQKLSSAPAAIYVITQEDIWRTGASSIAEALRMVPGLDVARTSPNRWAVSSRGFNGTLSNQMQVLIDGRSIYTPVFSGVYWDDQSTLIQDIDRIEVIRGPGASLWGANAVNGVINIITKPASETQGNLVSALGSHRGGRLEARHGGKSDDTYYRMYGQYTNAVNDDPWYRARAGFRADKKSAGSRDSYTLQGDIYGGEQETQSRLFFLTAPFSRTIESEDTSYGGNILGRWTRKISNDSQLSLQGYVDYYTRLEAAAAQRVGTADIQLQHDLHLNESNHFTWGSGVRIYSQSLAGSFSADVNDRYSIHEIFSAFLQNEFTLMPNELYFTAGSKFEYNDFTGFEIQPTARLAWQPVSNQTLWASVSRAVRTPSNIENDVSLAFSVTAGAPPSVSRAIGNTDQESEELIAYEIGHRIQPTQNLSFDTALFYNDYDKLLTVGAAGTSFLAPDGSSLITPYLLGNAGSGRTWGGEIAANWNIHRDWRVTGSYSYLRMDLDEGANTLPTLENKELQAPRHQFSVRSYYNVSDTVHWDNMLYYVGPVSSIDEYLRYDTRISWLAMPGLELSLMGRNLLDPRHPEFPSTFQSEVGRAVVGQVSWEF